MARTFERMTITLPPKTAEELRGYAKTAHGGKLSPAVAELVQRGLKGVTKS
jgi:hypothetical protein